MKIFELRYDDWDIGFHYHFLHEDESKNQKIFEEDICFLMKKYGEEYLKKEHINPCIERWVGFIIPKLEELGYKQYTFETVDFHGGHFYENIKMGKYEEEQVIKWIGKELYDKAYKRADEIWQKNMIEIDEEE